MLGMYAKLCTKYDSYCSKTKNRVPQAQSFTQLGFITSGIGMASCSFALDSAHGKFDILKRELDFNVCNVSLYDSAHGKFDILKRELDFNVCNV